MSGLGPDLLGQAALEALAEAVAEAVDRFMVDFIAELPPPQPLPAIDRPLASWVKLLPPRDEPRLTEVRLSQQAYDLLRMACPTATDRPISAFDTVFGIPVVRDDLLPPYWWQLRDQHGQVMRAGIMETPDALVDITWSALTRPLPPRGPAAAAST